MATITITITDVASTIVNEDADGQHFEADYGQLKAVSEIVESAIENAMQNEGIEGIIDVDIEQD